MNTLICFVRKTKSRLKSPRGNRWRFDKVVSIAKSKWPGSCPGDVVAHQQVRHCDATTGDRWADTVVLPENGNSFRTNDHTHFGWAYAFYRKIKCFFSNDFKNRTRRVCSTLLTSRRVVSCKQWCSHTRRILSRLFFRKTMDVLRILAKDLRSTQRTYCWFLPSNILPLKGTALKRGENGRRVQVLAIGR